MDPRILELQYRVEHEHADGSWGALVEEGPPLDSAETDPERRWSLRRVFRCTSCDQLVTLTEGDDTASPDGG
jgi:hypothetical protein